ncbi:MAG: tRNA (N6-threonylcarbamoyladenosine(37)-N6)-methyltransferase TrmO [bacterium]|jgi:tRNA-Thr(GGU) m(6)t(6)A37 methyltransferase TsaA
MIIQFTPIGIIHTPHQNAKGTPLQVHFADGIEGTVEIYPEFMEGLKDLEGFDRIWLLYHFHKAAPQSLTVVPYMDTCSRGLFSTRAPCRPNPIGISPVKLLEISGNRLRVSGVDMLDHSPVLDIKPYIAAFDCFEVRQAGWYDRIDRVICRADDRFENQGE